jgi:hypothetical protein
MRIQDMLPAPVQIVSPWPARECREAMGMTIEEITERVRSLVFLRCGKIHDMPLPQYRFYNCPDAGENMLCGHLNDDTDLGKNAGPRFLAAIWVTAALQRVSWNVANEQRKLFTDTAAYLRCVDDSAYVIHRGYSQQGIDNGWRALPETRELYDQALAEGRRPLTVINQFEAKAEPPLCLLQSEVLAALGRT